MSIAKILAVLILAPLLAGCEDPREFDLVQFPPLTLEELTPDLVRFSWGDAFEDAIEYRVERRRKGRDWRVISRITAAEREYTDDTVEELRTYRYRLWALFTDNGSARSVILVVDVPERPVAVPLHLSPWVPAGETGVVSWDGTKLARVVDSRVLITNLASGRSTLATRGELGPESDIAWMPDSTKILLAAEVDGESVIYIYDPATGRKRVLARGATAPEVLPDEAVIRFVRDGVTMTLPIGALPEWRGV